MALVVLRSSAVPTPAEAAFSWHGRIFGAIDAIWDDRETDAANVGWLPAAIDGVAPDRTGAYVGEADLDRPHRALGCLSPASAERLATLQGRYDPKGVFLRRARPASIAAE